MSDMYYYPDIRTHRENAGISRVALAREAGVGRDLVTSAEKHNPHRREKLISIINALNENERRVTLYGKINPDEALTQK